MDLYIANGTRQIFDFHYRLPEVNQPRRQTINVGKQVRISGDLTTTDIDAIIDQYKKYGMISADEITTGRSAAPLAYQVGKPISPIRIEHLLARNQGVLVMMGKESRQNAAIVMATNLGQSMREQNVSGDLQEVEIDAIEETRRDGATSEDRIEEKTIVTREGREPRGPTERANQGSKRGRRAA